MRFRLKKRNVAFSIYGMSALLGPAVGPTIGGIITDHFSWRWIFLIITWLSRATQRHWATLTAHASALDPLDHQTVANLSQQLGSLSAARSMVSQMIGRQASMLAFIDDYRTVAGRVLLCLPLVFLFGRSTRTGLPGLPEGAH